VHPFLDAKKEREAHSWGLKVVDGLFWIMIDFGLRMQKVGPYGHGWSRTLQAWELKKHAENIKAIDRLSQTSPRNRNWDYKADNNKADSKIDIVLNYLVSRRYSPTIRVLGASSLGS
jgi:hypothetical protein